MFAGLTHTVTATHVTSTVDAVGDGTEAKATTTCSGVLFAPEGLQENNADAAPVVGDATLYGQLPRLDADDTVEHPVSCCDGDDFAHGVWHVVGGSKGWGHGDRAIPIRKTSET